MRFFEIFSKRQKKLRGEAPDVYQYETIPQELRVQVVHIWWDVWGKETVSSSLGHRPFFNAYRVYEEIHDAL